MTQRRDFTQASRRSAASLIGLLSGISIAASGVAIAQTSPDASPVPSAQDLLGTDAPAPAAQPEPAAPEPVVEAPRPAAPSASAPESTPATPSAESPVALPSPSGSETVGRFDSPYIDATPYRVGATRPSIVFSERSSGCQRTIQAGQTVPSNLCAGGRSGSPDSINLGPISFSSRGVQINSGSALDFYNLTSRPAARLGNGDAAVIFPLSIPAAITSSFGWRVHPIFGSTRFHAGTDIGAPAGTPVLAAYSGRVAIADFMRGYGLTVILQHNNGEQQTLYAHMSEIFVRPGEQVEQGTVIGRVGSTGNSTGPHLHFEVRQRTAEGWVAVNAGGMLENALGNFWSRLQNRPDPEEIIALKDLSKASQVAGTASSILARSDRAVPGGL